MKIRVERTIVEYADVEVPVDSAEFAEWTTGPMTEAKVREFVEADRDWPENISEHLDTAFWTKDSDDIRLVSNGDSN